MLKAKVIRHRKKYTSDSFERSMSAHFKKIKNWLESYLRKKTCKEDQTRICYIGEKSANKLMKLEWLYFCVLKI